MIRSHILERKEAAREKGRVCEPKTNVVSNKLATKKCASLTSYVSATYKDRSAPSQGVDPSRRWVVLVSIFREVTLCDLMTAERTAWELTVHARRNQCEKCPSCEISGQLESRKCFTFNWLPRMDSNHDKVIQSSFTSKPPISINFVSGHEMLRLIAKKYF